MRIRGQGNAKKRGEGKTNNEAFEMQITLETKRTQNKPLPKIIKRDLFGKPEGKRGPGNKRVEKRTTFLTGKTRDESLNKKWHGSQLVLRRVSAGRVQKGKN